MPAQQKRSSASIVTPQEYSGSNTLDMYNEGVYINSVNLLFGTTVSKLRPNNDFLKIRGGKRVEMTEGAFNDLESPSPAIVSGTNLLGDTVFYPSYFYLDRNSEIPIGGGSLTGEQYTGYDVAPSHYNMRNEFGQPNTHQDGSPFTEISVFPSGAIDPVYIITTSPFDRVYPEQIVNSTDSTSLDGTIDQLELRREIVRSYPETPFRFRGIKSDIGNTDTFLRSVIISTNTLTPSARINSDGFTLRGIEPFLDAGDEFGLDDLVGLPPESCGPVSGFGYTNDPVARVEPFLDTADDIISSLLVSGSDIADAILGLDTEYPSHISLALNEISLSRGFDYIESQYGFDSIAFGGLLKT